MGGMGGMGGWETGAAEVGVAVIEGFLARS
jgi:hypothetical protein